MTILIVDDEALIRRTVRRVLERRGHMVEEAADAATGLRMLSSQPFDVLLLDYHLPDRRDLSVLREARELSPQTAVFMMTAHGDAKLHGDATILGARRVVDKPFQMGPLIDLLESTQTD